MCTERPEARLHPWWDCRWESVKLCIKGLQMALGRMLPCDVTLSLSVLGLCCEEIEGKGWERNCKPLLSPEPINNLFQRQLWSLKQESRCLPHRTILPVTTLDSQTTMHYSIARHSISWKITNGERKLTTEHEKGKWCSKWLTSKIPALWGGWGRRMAASRPAWASYCDPGSKTSDMLL